jgi:peptidoglycan hydrolase-like protein with peptidoglycan-binding domain
MPPRRALALVIITAVVAAAVGWFVGSRVKSPAEAAAEAEPPEPSLITVAVESRLLSSNVIVRGTGRFDEPLTVQLDGSGVITRAPERGATLDEGAVALEASGRPFFVLEGEIPMYRDLRPGNEGEDVLQLEEALARLGHDPGEVDGVYDSLTQTAINAWYEQWGYVANGPTPDEQARLDASESAVNAAAESLRLAERALSEAGQPPLQSMVLQQNSAVADAESELAAAVAAEEMDNLAATRAVQVARDALAAAAAGSQAAVARLAQAQAGIHPDTGLPPTAAELAELQQGATAAAAAEATAAATLAEAEGAVSTIAAAGADRVRRAQDQLAIAKASRAEALATPDTSALSEDVRLAREAKADADDDLTRLQAEIGITMPRSELTFLPAFPLRIDAVPVSRGDPASGTVMTVTASELIIASSLSLADRPLVAEGDLVTVELTSLGLEVAAVVDLIAPSPGTNGLDNQHYYMEVAPEETPPELRDSSVKLTIPVESTEGEVLAVPYAALSAAADGSSRVEVETAPGVTRFVKVAPGLAAQGLVEVTPLEGALSAGDRVVVGR